MRAPKQAIERGQHPEPRRLTERLVGIGVALCGCVLAMLPYDLEQGFGLPLLFHLRGPVPVTAPVAIVALNHDEAAQQRLGLTSDYSRWPRVMHAAVIDKLTAAGARVIAFDVIFGRNAAQTAAANASLAEALRRANRVILGVKIEAQSRETSASGEDLLSLLPLRPRSQADHSLLTISQCHFPLPELIASAAGVAPFQLPPQAQRIDSFWTFIESPCEAASLPAASLQLLARDAYPAILAAVLASDPAAATHLEDSLKNLSLAMFKLRALFVQKPDLYTDVVARLRRQKADLAPSVSAEDLHALMALYDPARPDARQLNLLGPSLTIPSYAFAAVYSLPQTGPEWEHFKKVVGGKVVFVGASETDIENQKNSADAFSTVYDAGNGMRIQGVEIAATAFINLLQDNALQRLPGVYNFGILLLHSVLLLLLWSRLRVRNAAVASAALLTGYAGVCVLLFRHSCLWLPVIIPGVQTAVGASLAWLAKYLEAAQERSGLIRAVNKRLPPSVVRDFVVTGQIRRTVYGVCLASDIGDWTKLAGKLSEEELSDLMRAYFTPVFTAVEQNHGFIVDTAGDGMLAIWVDEELSPVQRRAAACHGALAINRAVARFNAQSAHNLPTRLGLHWGKLVLRDIGDVDEFDLKAFGIAVNMASRIESLNKWVGSLTLVTSDTTAELTEFLWRPMGRFVLEGLEEPLELFELIALKEEASEEQRWLCDRFASAMAAYRNRYFEPCSDVLEEILQRLPNDGPSLFYRSYAQFYRQEPPPDDWLSHITAPKTGPVPATARVTDTRYAVVMTDVSENPVNEYADRPVRLNDPPVDGQPRE